MLPQKLQHRTPGAVGGDVVLEPRIEKQCVRNAGDSGLRKDFRGRRLVIGDAARNRTVQSDVMAEDEVSPHVLLHHDQPAVRPDVDADLVPLAVATNRVHEDPLRIGHPCTRLMNGCLAKFAALKRHGRAAERCGSITSRASVDVEQKRCGSMLPSKEIALDVILIRLTHLNQRAMQSRARNCALRHVDYLRKSRRSRPKSSCFPASWLP